MGESSDIFIRDPAATLAAMCGASGVVFRGLCDV